MALSFGLSVLHCFFLFVLFFFSFLTFLSGIVLSFPLFVCLLVYLSSSRNGTFSFSGPSPENIIRVGKESSGILDGESPVADQTWKENFQL